MSKKIKPFRKKKGFKKSSSLTKSLYQSALSFYNNGLLAQAEETLKEILKKEPGNSDGLFLLSQIFTRTNRRYLSLDILQKAVSLYPHNHKYRGELIDLLVADGNYQAATSHYEEIIKQSAHNKDIVVDKLLVSTAVAYEKAGNFDKAIEKLKEANKIECRNKEALYHLARIYQAKGDYEKCIKHINLALELDPFFPQAIYLFSSIDKEYFTPEKTKTLESLIDNNQIGNRVKSFYAFTLHNIYDHQNDYDKAFEYLSIGNKLINRQNPFNINNTALFFENIKKVFSGDFLKNTIDLTIPSITPIFIVGMPRSGTTLVEQILASHNEVCAGGEILALPKIALTFNPQSESIKDQLVVLREKYMSVVSRTAKEGAHFVTDKMPQNFLFISFILTALPFAKIIHCKRNPVATCFSCFQTLFSDKGQEFSYDLQNLAQYYLLYQEMISFWNTLLPESILQINYEDLIEDQENQTRNILDFCNLEWDEKCMDFYKTEREISTASVMQVRKPIYKSSVNKWEKYSKHLDPLTSVFNDHL